MRPKVMIWATLSWPYFSSAVVDDFLSSFHAEVGINVGKLGSFGVEKALEKKSVVQGVQHGEAGQVGDQAARRRASTGTYGDIVLAGELDEVPDDQEVGGETLCR